MTATLEGGEWLAARPGRTLPPVPILQETGWDPETGLDGYGKYRPHRDSIPDPLVRSSFAIPTELPGPPPLLWKQHIYHDMWYIYSNVSYEVPSEASMSFFLEINWKMSYVYVGNNFTVMSSWLQASQLCFLIVSQGIRVYTLNPGACTCWLSVHQRNLFSTKMTSFCVYISQIRRVYSGSADHNLKLVVL